MHTLFEGDYVSLRAVVKTPLGCQVSGNFKIPRDFFDILLLIKFILLILYYT